MPQMSPMPWILVMILTLSSMLMITLIIYFNMNLVMSSYKKKLEQKVNKMMW